MIAIQVIGDDTAVAFAGSQGNFELNAMRPIIINNFLHSATILADGCEKFRTFSVEGTELDEKKIAFYVEQSLMLVTALSPVIGYQKSAYIAEKADADGSTLREAALASGDVDASTSDKICDPRSMVGDGVAGARGEGRRWRNRRLTIRSIAASPGSVGFSPSSGDSRTPGASPSSAASRGMSPATLF